MKRQSGSVSAGFVAPPPPPTDNLVIFTQSGDWDMSSVGRYVSISGNYTRWWYAQEPNQYITVPVPGTFSKMQIFLKDNLSGGDSIFSMKINSTVSPVSATITNGTNFGTSGANTIHVSAGDTICYTLAGTADDVSFTVSVLFTPD